MQKRPGKREDLCRWLHATGLQRAIGHLPRRDCLLVLNYHRLGDADSATYDSEVFSATPQAFESQMEFVARHLHPVSLDESVAWAGGNADGKYSGLRTLITFDDGYVDNFEFARPVLRRLGIQGVFFLPTAFIGTRIIPWWDSIAYMMRNARRKRFSLDYPVELDVDIESIGCAQATSRVLGTYKLPAMTDPARFMDQVETATHCPRPEATGERCFMNWDESRTMVRDGMAIGAHTHTHRLLGSLPEEEQLEELLVPRSLLRENAGVESDALAYPVGLPTSFTGRTMLLAAQAGYRAAFSFYGGVNRRGRVNRFDIRRVSPEYGQSVERFQTQTTMAAVAGRYWP
jgi:peptidoglycan/xylan/chitin deacetylase (PgdA/CDA1 family)